MGTAELAHGLVELLGLLTVVDVTAVGEDDELGVDVRAVGKERTSAGHGAQVDRSARQLTRVALGDCCQIVRPADDLLRVPSRDFRFLRDEEIVRLLVLHRRRGDHARAKEAWDQLVENVYNRVRTRVAAWRWAGKDVRIPRDEVEDVTQLTTQPRWRPSAPSRRCAPRRPRSGRDRGSGPRSCRG